MTGAESALDLTLVVEANDGLPNGWTIVNVDYWLVAENAPFLSGPPVTTTVEMPKLSLTKWAFRNEVFAGSRLDYGILLGNTGGGVRNLVVSDTLPLNSAFGGCSCTDAGDAALSVSESTIYGASYTCGMEGDEVVWRVGRLIGNHSLQMTFWVTADVGLAEGDLIVNNKYMVGADNVPLLPGSPAVTTTVRRLDVSISKLAWPNPVTVSQQLFFTITVENDGSLLQDLTVSEILPDGVRFSDCGGALCEFSYNEQRAVRWWLPTLPADSKRELTLRAFPSNVTGDLLINAFYSVWIPAARQSIMGSPVEVTVINPYPQRRYLPIMLMGITQ
jgi:hypothetical protein